MAGSQTFGWIEGSVIGSAGCLTLIEAAQIPDTVAAFGGSGRTRRLALDQVPRALGDTPSIALRKLDGWLLVIEVNGWQGARPEILRQISRDTRAVSAFWNVNLKTRFSLATNGQMTTTFDAVFPERRDGSDPDALETLRRDLAWDEQDPVVPLMLALAARVSGQEITPDRLSGDFLVAPIEPQAQPVPRRIDTRTQPLTHQDPPIAWALRAADEADLRRTTRAALEQAITASGLDAERAITIALQTDPPTDSPALQKAGRRALAQARRNGADEPQHGARWHAISAVRNAASPDPIVGAFTAIAAARTCLQAMHVPLAPMRAALLGALDNPAPPAGSLGLVSPPEAATAQRYQWIQSHWLATAGQLILVKTPDMTSLVDTITSEPAHQETGIPYLAYGPLTALRQVGPWAVALASGLPWPNAPEFELEDLAPTTELICARWTSNGRSMLWHLDHGHTRTIIDPQRPDLLAGEAPHELDPILTDLPLPTPPANPADYAPALLTITERLTALSFTPDWLDVPHLLIRPAP